MDVNRASAHGLRRTSAASGEGFTHRERGECFTRSLKGSSAHFTALGSDIKNWFCCIGLLSGLYGSLESKEVLNVIFTGSSCTTLQKFGFCFERN